MKFSLKLITSLLLALPFVASAETKTFSPVYVHGKIVAATDTSTFKGSASQSTKTNYAFSAPQIPGLALSVEQVQAQSFDAYAFSAPHIPGVALNTEQAQIMAANNAYDFTPFHIRGITVDGNQFINFAETEVVADNSYEFSAPQIPGVAVNATQAIEAKLAEERAYAFSAPQIRGVVVDGNQYQSFAEINAKKAPKKAIKLDDDSFVVSK